MKGRGNYDFTCIAVLGVESGKGVGESVSNNYERIFSKAPPCLENPQFNAFKASFIGVETISD